MAEDSDFFDSWVEKSNEGDKSKHTIVLEVVYVPMLANADQECFPELHFYLSSFCGRGLAVELIYDDLESDEKENKFQVTLNFSMRSNHANNNKTEIPNDTNLNIRCFARHLTDKLERPLNEAGDSIIPLSILFEKKTVFDYLIIPGQEDTRRIEKLSKGSISVTILSSTAKLSKKSYFSKPYDIQAVLDYIKKDRAQFERWPAAFESTKRITAFVFRSDMIEPGAIFQDTGTRKPGSKSADYIKSNLQLGLRRYYGNLPAEEGGGPSAHAKTYDLENFYCKNRTQSTLLSRIEALMWAVGVYANSCTYITDIADLRRRSKDANGLLSMLLGKQTKTVKKMTADYDEKSVYQEFAVKLIESFRNPFPRGSGDCDDFTHAILMFVYTLRKYIGDDCVLQAARDLSQLYVFCSCLIGVRSAALQDMQSSRVDLNNVHLGGHMTVLAIPRLTYLKEVKSAAPTHPLVAHLEEQMKQHPEWFVSDLPIIPVEGTGMLKPTAYQPSEDSLYFEISSDVKRENTPFPAVADVAKGMFYYDPDGVNFYQVPILLTSPEMHPYPEVIACKRSRFPNDSHLGTRGVLFKELMEIDKNPDICLVPTAEITGDIATAAQHAVADMYPVYKAFRTIPVSEQVQFSKRTLNLSAPEEVQDYCHYYVAHHNDTPKMREEIFALAKRHKCEVATTLEFVHKSPNGKHIWNVVYTLYRQIPKEKK